MFLLWLAVFIGFSGLGGLSTGGEMLIVARFVTGASAGFLTPASLSIITTSFVGGDVRNRALLIYGAAGAAGFSLGMVARGPTDDGRLAVGVLRPGAVRFAAADPGGADPDRGPGGSHRRRPAGAGPARARPVRPGRGRSALETGLALLIAGIDAAIAPTLTPLPVRRFGNVALILTGMVLAALAYATFLRIGDDWAYPLMLPGLELQGFAFAYGPLTIAATEVVAEHEQGLAGGLFNASTTPATARATATATAVHSELRADVVA